MRDRRTSGSLMLSLGATSVEVMEAGMLPGTVVVSATIRLVWAIKAEVLKVSKRNSVAGRFWLEWLPIHELKVEEVFGMIRDAGEQPHWAYGAGNDRLSCIFCVMASRRDLINGARHNPEIFDEYIAMEKQTGYTMHMSRIPLATGTGPEPVPVFTGAEHPCF